MDSSESSGPAADGGLDAAAVSTVSLGGLRVRYLVAGDGPPVVLLHGGGWDSARLSWRETIPALAESFTVYALDWPGYGGSAPPERPPTTDSFVDVLDRFLDALDVDETSLVGISMGGGIALGFALECPDRVSKLALVDSYGLGGTVPGGALSALVVRIPGLASASERVIRRSRRLTALSVRGIVHRGNLTDELVDDVYRLARGHDSRAWRAFQRDEVGFDGLRTNYLDQLPDLSVPTLLIHGENDRLVPSWWAVRAGALIPEATVRLLPRCGHWPPRERPTRFNELLTEFLA